LLNVRLRFYAQLNDFLEVGQRQRTFAHALRERASIKDVIESLGPPHTEIGLILVDGGPVGFDYVVRGGERISVYPPFGALAIPPAMQLQPALTGEAHFVLDVHLGKLAAYLRTLGFDALYPEEHDDAYLAEISAREGRVMLSRDRGLLKRNAITYGYYVRATEPRQQVIEVLRRYDLFEEIEPFRRCVNCNGRLVPVAKSEIADRLQPDTRRYYDEFRLCEACSRIYWKGSHYERMQQFIDWVRAQAALST
jgi:hypothetical protein